MSAPLRCPLLTSICLIAAFGPSRIFARDLGFEERVRAQSALARVYYSHQVGTGRTFENAVPRPVLEKKVITYLQESAALERFWHRPITAEMLRREMERMARRTRMPDRLRELFAALDNDPFLIQECLVRPALAARLVDSYAAFDDRIHHGEREKALRLHQALSRGATDPVPAEVRRTVVDLWESGHQPALHLPTTPAGEPPPGAVQNLVVDRVEFDAWRSRLPRRVGEAGPLREEREAFVTFVLLDSDEHRLRIAAYAVPKRSRSDWWREVEKELDPSLAPAVASAGVPLPKEGVADLLPCACGAADFWDNGSLDDMPEPRTDHSAVWTGSLMIVWGGRIYLSTNTGSRYDPATDTWTPTSTAGVPLSPQGPTLIWTGDLVILYYGGATGAMYDPSSDSWSPITAVDAPPPALGGFSTVWTGSEMILWGGHNADLGTFSNLGYRFNPSGNTWTSNVTQMGAPSPRMGASVAWTGSEMLVWSGGDDSTNFSSGGRYNPASDTWAPMSALNAPPASRSAFAAWTGDRMLIWTGAAGGRYDPVLDSWQGASTAGAPANIPGRTAVWTGSEMIVWGGFANPDYFNDGARYNPSTDTWMATSLVGAPSGRFGHTAVWAGDEMIVWGGDDGVRVNTGGRYHPATDSWVPTSTGSGPSPRSTNAIWTGSRMLVWGGSAPASGSDPDPPFISFNSGGQYDPALDTWFPISTLGAPSPRGGSLVWTGNRMIVWGGYDGTAYLDTGSRYDPVADNWTPTSRIGAPAPRSSPAKVWSGTEMIVWGGWDGTSYLNSGGRYNPVADTWAPLSPINAPPGARSPMGFWTGSRMLVWGGYNVSYPYGVNTGGLYDPIYDSWRPTSLSGAPSPRMGASVVWTGDRMIVWGGESESYLDSGARYDPVSDSWVATSLSGVPLARSYHSAVWTGTRMVLWGGFHPIDLDPIDPFLSSGGIYDPVADAWAGMSTAGAPKGRCVHASVWTGERMLVWGGEVGYGSYTSSGGSYCGVFPPHYYEDADADGFGNSGSSLLSCSQPAGYVPLPGDCADADATRWAAPSEALNVRFNDATTLAWSAPAQMGATSVLYDALRSVIPSDFVGGGTCLVTDSPLLSATDATVPASGAVLNYLVRAQNGCPSGSGSLGSSSGGITRAGLNCP